MLQTVAFPCVHLAAAGSGGARPGRLALAGPHPSAFTASFASCGHFFEEHIVDQMAECEQRGVMEENALNNRMQLVPDVRCGAWDVTVSPRPQATTTGEPSGRTVSL